MLNVCLFAHLFVCSVGYVAIQSADQFSVCLFVDCRDVAGRRRRRRRR